VGDFAALHVLEGHDIGIFMGNDLQFVPEGPICFAHNGEGNVTRQVYTEAGGAGGDTGDMQPPGAHGFHLGRIGFSPVPADFLAGFHGEVIHEFGEHVFVYRRILDRGIRKDQGAGVEPFARIFRGIRHQVAVFVTIPDIQGSTILARVGRSWKDQAADQDERQTKQQPSTRQQCVFHRSLLQI